MATLSLLPTNRGRWLGCESFGRPGPGYLRIAKILDAEGHSTKRGGSLVGGKRSLRTAVFSKGGGSLISLALL